MKALKLIMAALLFLGIAQAEVAIVAWTCLGTAIGWYYYEKRRSDYGKIRK